MLSKHCILLVAFLAYLSSSVVAASELNYNQPSIKGLARAYGFIIGQEFTLDKIKKEFPEFSVSILLAESKFNSSFPSIKAKLKEQLVGAMGKNNFIKVDGELKRQLQATTGKRVITKDIAQQFLHQVKERAKGNIDSPTLEYMLSVKYLDFPVNEFLDGYRQKFTSKGHRKAQGLEITLQLPKSWKAKEGNRPHIVQKWVSQNGTGLEIILLDIRDNEGYIPTNREIESFISSGEVRNTIPDGAYYINSGVFTLEMQKGYWIEMTMTQERAGIKVYLHNIMYHLFFRGKAIGLMCQSGRPIEDKEKTEDAYKRIKPLCQKVLNSLVLLQAY